MGDEIVGKPWRRPRPAARPYATHACQRGFGWRSAKTVARENAEMVCPEGKLPMPRMTLPEWLRNHVSEKSPFSGTSNGFIRRSTSFVDNWPFEDKTDQRLPFILFTKDRAWNVGDFAA